MSICEKRGQIKNVHSLMFSKNDIEKNVKERFLFKNYKECFEQSLHLCKELSPILTARGASYHIKGKAIELVSRVC